MITAYITEFVEKYFPDSPVLNYVLVGEFIIGRYFNPAILDPEQFGLAQTKVPSSIAQRNLALISKILQVVKSLFIFLERANSGENFLKLFSE